MYLHCCTRRCSTSSSFKRDELEHDGEVKNAFLKNAKRRYGMLLGTELREAKADFKEELERKNGPAQLWRAMVTWIILRQEFASLRPIVMRRRPL